MTSIVGRLRRRPPDRWSSTSRRPRQASAGRRLALVAGALVVAAVATAAVAVASLRGAEYDVVVDAARRTLEARTARVAITTVTDGGMARPKQRTDIVGLVDFARGGSELEVRVGQPQLSGRPAAGTVPLLVTTVGQDVYVRFPEWPDGTPWDRLPAAEEPGGVTAAGFASLLVAMRGGVTNVTEVGTETIGGEEVRRLRVTVDLPRAAERADPPFGALLTRAFQASGQETLTLDVWLDDRFVRRVGYETDIAEQAAGPNGSPVPLGSQPPSSGSSGEPTASADPTPTGDAPAPVGPGAALAVVVQYDDFGVPFVSRAPETAEDVLATPSPMPTGPGPS